MQGREKTADGVDTGKAVIGRTYKAKPYIEPEQGEGEMKQGGIAKPDTEMERKRNRSVAWR